MESTKGRQIKVKFAEQRIQALEAIARGSSLEETLQLLMQAWCTGAPASAGICIASALLLWRDDRLHVAATSGLNTTQRATLETALRPPFSEAEGYGALSASAGAQFHPLRSGSAESLGVLAIFRPHAIGNKALEEILSIAILAVEQKNLLEELTWRADIDSLTGTWKRQRLESETDRALHSAHRTGSLTGLIYLDLDRFRLINEVLGHHVGDEVLRLAAARFQCVAGTEALVARARGDEFLVLLPRACSASMTTALGQRLVACVREPFHIGDHELFITATAGSCTGDSNEFNASELESSAYIAINHAKREGRNRVVEFDFSMAGTPPERLEMEGRLRNALAKGEMLVHYQPQVRLTDQRIVGFEALARWKHPEVGFISPATFIPVAEEIGVVEEIGRWVFTEALRQIQQVRAIKGAEHLRVAVNVSAIQVGSGDFCSWVLQRIDEAGMDANSVELEFTESVIMKDFEHVRGQMQRLRDRGVLLSIDDFGTGHSSLACLHELPFQRLKIDRAFVQAIHSEHDRPPLLENIIRLAHALHVPVIAEGIETAIQTQALLEMECDAGQGFLFSRPIAPESLMDWVTANLASLDPAPSPASGPLHSHQVQLASC